MSKIYCIDDDYILGLQFKIEIWYVKQRECGKLKLELSLMLKYQFGKRDVF